MRPFKAGLVFFLLVFALGSVLGPTRELWAVPRFGPVRALLFEAVIMLIAMIVSSWWVMRGFDVPRTLGSTIPMGLVALAIFVPARGCPMGTRVIPTRISCELRRWASGGRLGGTDGDDHVGLLRVLIPVLRRCPYGGAVSAPPWAAAKAP